MISFINDQLFIGNQWDAESPPPFVTAILWTALETSIAPPDRCLVARIPMREFTQPDPIDLEIGIDWLTKHLPSQKIMVGCRQGLGRSTSMVIAYLCCRQNLSYETALQRVMSKRPGTTPLPFLSETIRLLQERAIEPSR